MTSLTARRQALIRQHRESLRTLGQQRQQIVQHQARYNVGTPRSALPGAPPAMPGGSGAREALVAQLQDEHAAAEAALEALKSVGGECSCGCPC